ncbi:MAG: ABC transporter substrate-binding protein [Acidimicrobiales bacterium]
MNPRQLKISRRGHLKAGVVVVAGALLLAACGSTGNATPPASGGRITLTAWNEDAGQAATALAQQVAGFNASQSKYRVVTQFIAAAGHLFTPKLLTALSSHSGPNLVVGYSDPQSMGQVIQTGDVVDLGSYMSSSLPRPASDFYPGMLKASTFNGKVYSFPTDGGDYAVIYNKKLFKNAGITSTPTTWAQLTSDAKTLTKGGVYGFYVPFGTTEWTVWTYESMLWSEGGHLLNSSRTKVGFNTPAGVAALDVWLKLIRNHLSYPSSLANSSQSSGYPGFQAGKVAMYIDGAYNLAIDDKALGKSNVGVFAFPATKTLAMNTGTDVSFMLKGSKAQQQGEWEFLHYMTKAAVQAKWDVATGFLPTVTGVVNTATFKSFVASDPRLKAFVSELAYAHTRPSITAYAQISTALGQQLDAAFLGQESASKALSTAAAQANQALASAG